MQTKAGIATVAAMILVAATGNAQQSAPSPTPPTVPTPPAPASAAQAPIPDWVLQFANNQKGQLEACNIALAQEQAKAAACQAKVDASAPVAPGKSRPPEKK